MKLTPAYRTLAEKILFQQNNRDFNMPDSLLRIVSFAFTEEEAQIASHLGYIPRTAKVIAQKIMRPLHEVEPVLKSLAERLLILSLTTENKTVYSLLPLIPGISELQMLLGKVKDEEYGKEYARLFDDFYNEVGDILKPVLDDRDKFELARIIPVEQSIQGNSSINTIAFPSDHFSEVIDRNTSFVQLECPCRTATEYLGKGCDKPKDVCGAMGVVADFLIEKGLGRRVSKEEFIDAKVRAAEAGLVNLVDNILDPMQFCACCGCCCYVLNLITRHNFPALIADSHFEPVIDTQNCQGCGKCIKWCPVNAMSLNDKINDKESQVDYKRCIGCGVCVTKCSNNAISLKERAKYRPPPDNIVNFAIQKYLETKKYDASGFLPRVSLGIGRLLSNVVQPKLAGPKYKYNPDFWKKQ
jgi:Pyruvate/2-oxoacid:ferredoxin oxidoreductase delta subunit